MKNSLLQTRKITTFLFFPIFNAIIRLKACFIFKTENITRFNRRVASFLNSRKFLHSINRDFLPQMPLKLKKFNSTSKKKEM